MIIFEEVGKNVIFEEYKLTTPSILDEHKLEYQFEIFSLMIFLSAYKLLI